MSGKPPPRICCSCWRLTWCRHLQYKTLLNSHWLHIVVLNSALISQYHSSITPKTNKAFSYLLLYMLHTQHTGIPQTRQKAPPQQPTTYSISCCLIKQGKLLNTNYYSAASALPCAAFFYDSSLYRHRNNGNGNDYHDKPSSAYITAMWPFMYKNDMSKAFPFLSFAIAEQ